MVILVIVPILLVGDFGVHAHRWQWGCLAYLVNGCRDFLLIGDMFAPFAQKPCPVSHGRFHLASYPFTAKSSPLGKLMTDCLAEVKLGLWEVTHIVMQLFSQAQWVFLGYGGKLLVDRPPG